MALSESDAIKKLVVVFQACIEEINGLNKKIEGLNKEIEGLNKEIEELKNKDK